GAEPIVLGFDDLSYYGRSDDLPIEHYPGVFFVSLESEKDLAGNGFLATEDGVQGSIWQTLSGYRPYYDSPDYPRWIGRRFDFIGMAVRNRFPGGGSHRLTVLGFRNYELVGSRTAEFGEAFSWHAFDLKNVDLLLLVEPGGDSHPFL